MVQFEHINQNYSIFFTKQDLQALMKTSNWIKIYPS